MKTAFANLFAKLHKILAPVVRYRVLLFILLVAGLYGYLVLQINQASSVQPSENQEVVAVHHTPRIDPSLVQQLQQLQDNSVSVQTLFNEARTNPFQ
jgi:hypothetical protein